MTFCPQCGKPVAPSDPFCTACGTEVTHAPQAPGVPLPIAARRPPGLGVIGATTILLAAIGLFLFLGVLAFMWSGASEFDTVLADAATQLSLTEEETRRTLLIGMTIGSVMSLLLLGTGIAVLRAQPWAWSAMIALMAMNAIGSALSLPTATGFLGLGVSAIVILYFLRPEVRAWFGKAKRS